MKGVKGAPTKYLAELRQVREVSLLGGVDLEYWQAQLAPLELVPVEVQGRAQALLIAGEARYLGVLFRELSFAVAVQWPGKGSEGKAAYLVQSFNSCRFFAFCERTLFSTPYVWGEVSISVSPPVHIRLVRRGDCLFGAELGEGPAKRAESLVAEDGWEGAVFLPPRQASQKLFFTRVAGSTRRVEFLPQADTLTLVPHREFPVFRALLDSHFQPAEWLIRPDATHAKGPTCRRARVFS